MSGVVRGLQLGGGRPHGYVGPDVGEVSCEKDCTVERWFFVARNHVSAVSLVSQIR
jgi:hypothetical protein